MAKMDFVGIEKKWQQHWDKNGIYTFDFDPKKPVFSVDTPPPTVSGKMHMGHAFAYTQADVIARFQKMRGKQLLYPFGFDDNGLATGIMVEKEKNIRQKDFSRKEFIAICLEVTKKAEAELEHDFKSIGLACDWNLLYRTIDDYSRKQAQRSFLDLHKKKRVYQKLGPSMWCTKCQTAIAQAELEDLEKQSNFVFVRAEVEGGGELVYATTRPELLHACVCISVHPDDKRYKKVIGKKAKIPLSGKMVPIIADEFTKMDFGTGVVYWCPYGDVNDIEFMHRHPEFTPRTVLNKDGTLNELTEKYAGMKVLEARKTIIDDLNKEHHVVKIDPITHTTNVHERCKTPIEIVSTKQWFVKYLDLKKTFIQLGKKLNWHPKHFVSRYNNWVDGLLWDWSISRQRYFGVPFPVWYCKKCEKEIVAGKEELPIDPLHSKPKNGCSCGSNDFVGEKDVFDTWFTSSLSPQIATRWMEDKPFYKKTFPMSLRPQGHDIITLWAFSTIVKAHFHGDSLPWNNIMVNGWALDPKGKKMSKSAGNVIAPQKIIEKYCADALRYWATTVSLGEDSPFQEKEMIAGQKFLTKLHNIAKFVAGHAEKSASDTIDTKKLRPTDKWVLSRLNSVKKTATDALENYDFGKAIHTIRNFIWFEVADFYVEEVKYRVYSEDDPSADTARRVLQHVLWECLILLTPFLPHTTEDIAHEYFRKKLKYKSMHHVPWPKIDKNAINSKAEKTGELINTVISAIRKKKSEHSISMNTPVKNVRVFSEEKADLALLETAEEEIKNTMYVNTLSLENTRDAANTYTTAGLGLHVAINL
jgi:valyl-tRNA synthetase